MERFVGESDIFKEHGLSEALIGTVNSLKEVVWEDPVGKSERESAGRCNERLKEFQVEAERVSRSLDSARSCREEKLKEQLREVNNCDELSDLFGNSVVSAVGELRRLSNGFDADVEHQTTLELCLLDCGPWSAVRQAGKLCEKFKERLKKLGRKEILSQIYRRLQKEEKAVAGSPELEDVRKALEELPTNHKTRRGELPAALADVKKTKEELETAQQQVWTEVFDVLKQVGLVGVAGSSGESSALGVSASPSGVGGTCENYADGSRASGSGENPAADGDVGSSSTSTSFMDFLPSQAKRSFDRLRYGGICSVWACWEDLVQSVGLFVARVGTELFRLEEYLWTWVESLPLGACLENCFK